MNLKQYWQLALCIVFAAVYFPLTASPHHPEISFCVGAWGDDDMYYNLFAQESMDEPQYRAFLLSYDNRFYSDGQYPLSNTNENIEDWKNYLQISYQDAEYLVFKADRQDLRALTKGMSTKDDKLAFANKNFVKKHKQALLYIAYAKYLAPYMAVQGNRSYSWGNTPKHNVSELKYDAVIGTLEKSWHLETDKDLKIRYGYQLVRFAHYSERYTEAIDYFNDYVASLNYKPIIYYYALDQKGGAERALGNFMQAHHDFFRFFTHTKNRKEQAYTSMLVTRDLDFEKLLSEAKTTNEKNDLYMLLGYRDFNNPLSSIQKIIENDPNAPQAKVLMARAVNQLERNYFPVEYSCPYNHPDCMKNRDSYRIPLNIEGNDNSFLEETLRISERQSENPNVKEQDFWKLTSAWIYFIQKDYGKSALALEEISTDSERLSGQKDKLSALITISKQENINSDFEVQLAEKFAAVLQEDNSENNFYFPNNNTRNFVIDILANRYLLQKDYAKAFLLQNDISQLESYPQLLLLEAIEKFYQKKNKNTFENMLAENLSPKVYDATSRKMVKQSNFDVKSYISNMKGNIFLRQGDTKKAASFFEEVAPNFYNFKGFSHIPSEVFGYNRIECFECADNTVMQTDYLDDFDVIKPNMNKKELTRALITLEKAASGKGDKAAKAGYLLGNFYFNTSLIGYYRQFLTYSDSNAKNYKFHNYYGWNEQFDRTAPEYPLYYKNYGWKSWYYDDFEIPLSYLNLAMEQTTDEELKARILFAASKCEQGIFYSTQTDEDLNSLKDMEYSKRNAAKMEIKTSKYRSYFKQLKAYEHTDFYQEVKTYCKYFDYFTTNY
ncbi:hypothetical protein [Sinomicrobium sp.]